MASLPRDKDTFEIIFEQLGDGDCHDTAFDFLPEREETVRRGHFKNNPQCICQHDAGAQGTDFERNPECPVTDVPGQGTQTSTVQGWQRSHADTVSCSKEVQARKYKTRETQTFKMPIPVEDGSARGIIKEMDEEEYSHRLHEHGKGISSHLIDEIEAALKQNQESRAFLGHRVSWEASATSVQRVHTLRCTPRASSARAPTSGGERSGDDDSMDKGNSHAALPVAGISWNSSGNMLAVCYGRMDIEGPDTEGACIGVWNLQRVFVQPDKPDHLLPSSCSVTSVAFHPSHPAILVAGTFSGEVLAWNLVNDPDGHNNLAVDVVKGDRAHCDAVTAVAWSSDSTFPDAKCVTSSTDGTVVVWKLKDISMDQLWPIVSLRITAARAGDWLEGAREGMKLAHVSQQRRALGLTCMAFERFRATAESGMALGLKWKRLARRPIDGRELNHAGLALALEGKTELSLAEWTALEITDLRLNDFIKCGEYYLKPFDKMTETGNFLVGTETGGVFKCWLNFANVYEQKVDVGSVEPLLIKQILFTAEKVPKKPATLECPIHASYTPHYGPVHSVHFSPLQREVFASCGADGTVRIHNAQVASPLRVLEPSLSYSYALAWSPSKPLVLAVGTGDGLVLVYNFAVDATKPVETLELSDASNVGFVSFSPSGRDLAAGDWRGVACVWRLSHALHETWARDASDAIHHFSVAPDATKS